MGGPSHFLDINDHTMARKVVTHKRHGGLDAPRNSLDIPMETSYGLYAARDNILYAYHTTQESSAEDYYSAEAPIKKLISSEVSKRTNPRQNAPSVVARLMGVDMLPFDSKPVTQLAKIKKDNPALKAMGRGRLKNSSAGHTLSTSKSSKKLKFVSFGNYTDRISDQYDSGMNSDKPKRREHPQEEELQKFKKEFEAWQAARFHEYWNAVELSSGSLQLIAQEELNREKMFLYANSVRMKKTERLMEPKDLAELTGTDQMLTSGRRCKKKNNSAEEKGSLYSNGVSRTDFRASRLLDSDHKLDSVSTPPKIVILRPGPDRMDINEDLWNSTPTTSEDRGTIEDFLEEVKERLKSELQGKSSKRITTVRGGGIETPYWEKPSEPREIAQRIAQQVRESVIRDHDMNLLRSDSTRSYKNEIQFNATDSPEFMSRGMRRLLAERLRNVLNGGAHQEVPMVVSNSSTSSMLGYENGPPGKLRDVQAETNMIYPDSIENELDKQSSSFRRDLGERGMHHEELSPRNLIRSLSAPVSGTSFGKLLLEDRHILTGVQIRRKHEVIENLSVDIQKQNKYKFNIRQKVSSFRYSLMLGGRMFRKRVKSGEELDVNKNNFLRDITSGPTVMMNFFETHENSTEVPPSPASICSSIPDEFWRPAGYSSPVSSSSGVHQLEDSEMSHVFREINSNLSELRRKLDQLEGGAVEVAIKEQQPIEVDIEDQVEAYIRDLLVAAALYDGSFSRSLSKWDPLGKPISNQVFEEVEETYIQSTKNDEERRNDQGEKVNRKMILDLLNEVLPGLLRQPVNMSRYMEKAIGPVNKPPHGRELLSRAWEIMRVHVHPPADRSYYALDNMLAWDLVSNPWSRLMDDDTNALCRDIECQIIGDLVEETVENIKS